MSFLQPLETWLFGLPPLLTISIVGLFITLFTSLVYRFVTDQELMKTLKQELKDMQDLMKQHKDSPDKLMKINQEAMEKNMQYMKHSMRPTMFTMIPLLLIFGWLNMHIGFYPIMPDAEFDVWAEFKPNAEGIVSFDYELLDGEEDASLEVLTDADQTITNGMAKWKLKGDAGKYLLKYTLEGGSTQTQKVLITTQRTYEKPKMPVKDSNFKTLHVGNEPVYPLGFLGINWTWIWPYIIVSMIFSMTVRKLMKIS